MYRIIHLLRIVNQKLFRDGNKRLFIGWWLISVLLITSHLFRVELVEINKPLIGVFAKTDMLRSTDEDFGNLTGYYSDRAFDSDGDGRFNFLVIDVGVNITTEKIFYVDIGLISTRASMQDLTQHISARNVSRLGVGIHILSVHFDSSLIFSRRLNTSYKINYLEFGYLGNQGATYFPIYIFFDVPYTTSSYDYAQFDPPATLINIDGNEEFSKLVKAENWTGGGTLYNPYIIEDIQFIWTDSTFPMNLIDIRNTDAYFSILDCFLWGGTNGILFSNITGGIISHNRLMCHDTAIRLESAKNTIIASNMLDRSTNGIVVGSQSHNNSIINNVICDTNISLILGNTSQNNLIMLNDFKNNASLLDFGYDNSITNNYWFEWANYESIPLPVDSDPQSSPNHLIKPVLLYPNGGETVRDTTLVISWLPALDTFGHGITYSVYYSSDNGSSWTLLKEDFTDTSFKWDVSGITFGFTFLIKVVSFDSEGFFSLDISNSPFSIQSPLPPLSALHFGFFLLLIILLSLFILIKKQKSH
ncbi:MAG: NosD domain-containing protein [Candidatus Hermodarchaeota archaeon]